METTEIYSLIPTNDHDTKRALRLIGRETKRLKREYAGQELDNHLTLMKFSILKQLKAEKDRHADRIRKLDEQGIDTSMPV
jgi:hypothetical protein